MKIIVIVLATAIAGIGSVWIAALATRWVSHRSSAQSQIVNGHLLSMAAGALLATSFLHLLPEALESQAGAQDLFACMLVSLVFFFLLDKAELWHHGHEHGAHDHSARDQGAHDHSARDHTAHDHAHVHKRAGGWAVLFGDSVHAFGDGVLIAAAFVADVKLGAAAALAVLAHEIPHHMGDLVVLRQSSRGSWLHAVVKVSAAGSVTIVGGLVGYAFAAALHAYLPYFLVVGAASFAYVALADLIPQLQRRLTARETTAQIAWLAVGIGLVALATRLAH
jgi:zinc and cadmium transporter